MNARLLVVTAAVAIGAGLVLLAGVPTCGAEQKAAAPAPAAAPAAPAAPAAKGPMEPLKIQLPDPSFSGTPLDYWSENLEIVYKPREPFLAPKGAEIVSLNKPVTTSDVTATPNNLKKVTDGDKKFEGKSLLTLKPGVQYVQVDLEKKCAIYAIVVWHFHEYQRVYKDTIVRVSDDAQFKEGVTELFNNDHDNSSGLGVGKNKEYVEGAEGKLVDGKGTVARYVRLYSKGNSSDDANTYVEVEVWGKPAE